MDIGVYVALAQRNIKVRRALLESLTPREEKVIAMLYGIGKDCSMRATHSVAGYSEVAKHFGVSKLRVIQIENKAERKLRHHTRLDLT